MQTSNVPEPIDWCEEVPALSSTLQQLIDTKQLTSGELEEFGRQWVEEELPAQASMKPEATGLWLILSGQVRVPRRGQLLPGNLQRLERGSLVGLGELVRVCCQDEMRAWIVKNHEALLNLLGLERTARLGRAFGLTPRDIPGWLGRVKGKVRLVLQGTPPPPTVLQPAKFLRLPKYKFELLREKRFAVLLQRLLRVYQAELLGERIVSALAYEPRFGNVPEQALFRLLESAMLVNGDEMRLQRGEVPDGVYTLVAGSCGIRLPEGDIATVVAPACLGHKEFLLQRKLTGDAELDNSSSLVARIDGPFLRRLLKTDLLLRRTIHRGNPELNLRPGQEASHQILVIDGAQEVLGQLPSHLLTAALAERLAFHLQEHVLVLQLPQAKLEDIPLKPDLKGNGWVVCKGLKLPGESPDPFLPDLKPGMVPPSITGNVNVTLMDISGLTQAQKDSVLKALLAQKPSGDPVKLVYLATTPRQLPSMKDLPEQVELVPAVVLLAPQPHSLGLSAYDALASSTMKQRLEALGRALRGTGSLLVAAQEHLARLSRPPERTDSWPMGTVRFRLSQEARSEVRNPKGSSARALLSISSFSQSVDRLARAATNRRVGLALGGGGGFGYVHVALLQRLMDLESLEGAPEQENLDSSHRVPIDLVSGSSFGTMVGAFFCVAGAKGLNLMTEQGHLFTPLVPLSVLSSVSIQLALDAVLGPVKLDQLDVPLFPVVADADIGTEWDIDKGTVGYGVRASGSMPPFIAPTIEGNRRLLDGGIVANVPVNVLRAEGADLLIASNPISWVEPRGRTFPRVPLLGTLWRQLQPWPRIQDSVRLLRMLGRIAGEAQIVASDVAVYRPKFNSARLTSFAHGRQTMQEALDSDELSRFMQEVRARWRELLNNPLSRVRPDSAAGQITLDEEVFFQGDELVAFSKGLFNELVEFVLEHEEISSFELWVAAEEQPLAQRRAERLRKQFILVLDTRELEIKAQGLTDKSSRMWLAQVRRLEEASSREKRLLLKQAMEEAQARRLEQAAEQKAQAGAPDQARMIALQAVQIERSEGIGRLLSRMFELRGAVEWCFTANAAVTSMAWHPKNPWLAVGYKDGVLRVLDLSTGKVLCGTWAHPGGTDPNIPALAWSPEGELLASCGHDGALKTWKASARGLVMQHHKNVATWNHWGLAFAPGGRYLLGPRGLGLNESCSAGLYWLGQDFERLELLAGGDHLGEVVAAAWAPGGDAPRFAIAEKNKITLWGVTEQGPLKLCEHELSEATSLAWKDPWTLAVGTAAGAWLLRVEQSASDAREVSFAEKLPLDTGEQEIHQVAWTQSGQLLATAPADNTLHVWSDSGRLRKTLLGRPWGTVRQASCDPDSRFSEIALTWGNELASVWDVSQGRQVGVLGGHSGKIQSIAWAPNGEQLATASVDGKVQVWTGVGEDPKRVHWSELVAARRWGRAQKLGLPAEFRWRDAGLLIPMETRERQRAWVSVPGPEGTWLAAALPPTQGQDREVRFWEWDPGTPQPPPWPVSPGWFEECAIYWAPDGRKVALRELHRVSIWDAQSGQRLAELRATRVTRVAWHPSGGTLAIGQFVGFNEAVLLWNPESSSPAVPIVPGNFDGVWDLAWSPGGDRLAAAFNDSSVHLYEVTERGASKSHEVRLKHPAKRVAWAPHGNLLACGDESGGLTLWDIPNNTTSVPEGQMRRDRLQHLVWSKTGRQLFTADRQGYAVFWRPRLGGVWEASEVLDREPRPLHWMAFSADEEETWAVLMDRTRGLRIHPIGFKTRVESIRSQQGRGTEVKVAEPNLLEVKA